MSPTCAARRRLCVPPPPPRHMAPMYLQLMPVLLDACGSTHADLRQCAVYGVGLGASLAPEAFKPHTAAALAAVQAILSAAVSWFLGLG